VIEPASRLPIIDLNLLYFPINRWYYQMQQMVFVIVGNLAAARFPTVRIF
jgi:hypothetical protein